MYRPTRGTDTARAAAAAVHRGERNAGYRLKRSGVFPRLI